ncbi:MAG TPA: acyclic terpene utilization AtuA family protein [Candidatus Binatia bacterium]|nr:acyclic terpene utilization AtuA family protein [Candidatus Binatia bacterium]
MKSVVRIANAGGYWGDDPEALYRQVAGGPIDYVTSDFLAEITMVILHRQRARNPKAGFAYDFIHQLKPALQLIAERGITVIVNAGGINPHGCADAVAALCAELGVRLPIGVVSGDNLLDRLDALEAGGVRLDHMDGARSYDEIRGKIVAANVYLGAKPVVEALRRGARIIVTGRTTDAALILAPLMHEFEWAWDDWNRIAAGVVAGHILECGAQATGGNFTDWQSLPSMLDMGYPIVEAAPDGSFVVTKHPGTGGAVTCATVTEQLLYEIGDPSAYLTPDVSVDFTSFDLHQDGADRVRVDHVRGAPAPATLKASVVYSDGFKAVGTSLISGPNVIAKGTRLAEMLFHRLGDYRERRVDCVGYRGCWGGAAPEVEPNEAVFRIGVRDHDRRKIERFANHFLAFGLQAPPGFGIFAGRPDVQEALGFWPALVPRELVTAEVDVLGGGRTEHLAVPMALPGAGAAALASSTAPRAESRAAFGRASRRVRLSEIAHARSGDKGDHANIGVAARSDAAFEFLRNALTAARVKEYFADLVRGDVVRYELPNLRAFNFMLHNALGGGGTLSLRVDHQGKTLAQGLLQMELEVPEEVGEGSSARTRLATLD